MARASFGLYPRDVVAGGAGLSAEEEGRDDEARLLDFFDDAPEAPENKASLLAALLFFGFEPPLEVPNNASLSALLMVVTLL